MSLNWEQIKSKRLDRLSLGQNMIGISKQIITNEAMEPVGVIIGYQDWQKIEAILEQYRLLDNSQNLMSFTGTVQLTIDPLTFQQQEREAWS